MNPKFLIKPEIAILLKKNGYPQEGAEYYFDIYLNKTFSWREKKEINENTDVALPSYMELFDWLIKEEHPISVDWTYASDDRIIWDGNSLDKYDRVIYSDIRPTPYEVIEELIKKIYE